MSEIYVVIRNQAGTAMPSINGELVIVLLTGDGQFQIQQPVTLRTATAMFFALPAGDYTILARHSALYPTEVRQDVKLPEDTFYGVRFVYNEPDRRLIRIETEMRFL